MSDYVWEHRQPLPPGVDRTAEKWIRAVWQDTVPGLGPALRAAWRYGLGLRLGPGDDESAVLGWEITSVTDDEITVAAQSRLLVATNTVALENGSLTWTTTVDYADRGGRALWKPASLIHQATVPLTVKRAVGTASGAR